MPSTRIEVKSTLRRSCGACRNEKVWRDLVGAWLLKIQRREAQFEWVKRLPSGYVNSLLLKMAIEIVDFPIENGDFP
jgi:hypothetical protein